uniref:Proliferating cell nuclear antigen PCNA N-terminal domain-containing protein n=1 Tax=viral metagenome TaxID=1070528 RepID=A0A6C0D3S6_9ZZZZ
MATIHIHISDQHKAEIFSGIFQYMKLFTDQINLIFEKERFYIQSMDASRISIFEVFLPAAWFDRYEHGIPRNCTIGLNSTILYKILGTRDKGQDITIKFDSEMEDKLYVDFTSNNKTLYNKEFEMSLIDIDCEMMSIPPTESAAEFSIPSANFASIIGQLKLFGDSIDIVCNESAIQLTALSVESGKMSVKIEIDELNEFSIDEGSELTMSYSLANLHNICAYSKIAKEMVVHLTENFPMKIIYWLGEVGGDAKLVFYLAPKINDD